MKTVGAIYQLSFSTLLLAGVSIAPFHAAMAQDSSAFLACEQFTDRAERIACLEDALEAATQTQPPAAPDAAPAPSPAPAPGRAQANRPAPVPAPAPAPAATAAAPAPAAAEADEPSLLDRLRNFGRDDNATLSTDAEGQEQLEDTIVALETRRDLWIVTLSGGQVWMQEYPRTLNLREGDKVTISQGGFGNGYRLATDRLSGFIRVKRMR